jgi:hypothetical protein
MVDGFMIPHKVTLEVSNKDKNLKLIIEIGSVLFNETINADNKIPSKYEEAIIDY